VIGQNHQVNFSFIEEFHRGEYKSEAKILSFKNWWCVFELGNVVKLQKKVHPSFEKGVRLVVLTVSIMIVSIMIVSIMIVVLTVSIMLVVVLVVMISRN